MNIKRNQSTKQDLLCCRACLSTECRLFNIHQHKLSQAFTRISGTRVLKHQLPQYLCAQCCRLLRKCMSFKDMCLQTEQYLKLQLQKGELNTECIRRLDHSSLWLSLSLSETCVIDCVAAPPTGIKAEPNDEIDREEPTVDADNICEENINIDEANLVEEETHIDSIAADDVDNGRKTETCVIDCVVAPPTGIKAEPNDAIDREEPTVDADNICQENINIDEANLVEEETHIDSIAEDDVDNGRKTDSKIKHLNKINKVKIKEIVNEEDQLYVNKEKVVKTYKRKTTGVKKKMGIENIELHLNSDKVNVVVNQGGEKIDLDPTPIDNAKINIPNNINEGDLSDIDDIDSILNSTVRTKKRKPYVLKKKRIEMHLKNDQVNDVVDKDVEKIDLDAATIDKANGGDESEIDDREGQITIVDVDSILKTSKNKTDKCNENFDKDKSDAKRVRVLKQGRRGRSKKEKKIKYRNPVNDYMPTFDFPKFESDYGVKIYILNKQEQLEEIAARKQSVNYTSSQYKCDDCMKGFGIEAAFNNHRRRHSPSSGEHACDVCALRFRLPCLLNKHKDMHRLKFTCEQCGFVSRTSCGARAHHAAHNGKRFVCQHCERTFSKRSSCLSHVRMSHPAMNVACDACGETFVGQRGLKQHKALMHSESIKPQHFNCTTCSGKFLSLDALNRHTDSGEHSGCACEQCGESCASETALQAHVEARHPTESHRCEECDATFTNRAAYDLHHRRKHLNERWSARGRVVRKLLPRVASRATRGQFMCEQCGHIATNAALLRYHLSSHLAVKPFPCSHCEKTFITKAARKWHERRHTGEKPYKCSLCPREFSDQSNYKRHHDGVHLGIHANVACHLCARVFTTKSGVQLHVNSVHKGLPWPRSKRRQKAGK